MCLPLLSLGALAPTLSAQSSPYRSPGLPIAGSLGQNTRFDNDFNPAIGVVVDGALDAEGGQDGFDLFLRHIEPNMASQIDPQRSGLCGGGLRGPRDPTVEEAAVQFTGQAPRSDLRAGRFCLDFGKQM